METPKQIASLYKPELDLLNFFLDELEHWLSILMASYLLLFRQFISADTNHNYQRLEGKSPNSNEYIHTCVCVHVYIKLLPVKAGGKLLNKVMENVKQLS